MKVKVEMNIEGIYAGWLAKIIGIRLGAPVEGWTYEQIKNAFGVLEGYPVDYKDFAADDDSNGPFFFVRALEDSRKWEELDAQDIGEALLNYAPYEHGFFWWGGYGISTEHTAYLNLKHGIQAPKSGSMAQNGAMLAEQIGGQIFIDSWGLVTPGNPDLAAKLAFKAASVTHDGNGIYGGVFIATCISYAFVEKDIRRIIEKGLSYIPDDSEYAKIVQAVMNYYDCSSEKLWEKCFHYIKDNFGYVQYPGVCHIIPNAAVMILALLYGEGDFSNTLNICNRCGWDTDCNVANVATIMGVRNGLSDIDYEKWRKPINDFLVFSSVIGSLNISDIPSGALYMAKLAAKLAGEELPEPYDSLANERPHSCHFEFPGSTHGIRVRGEPLSEFSVCNTEESAATGTRSLKVSANRIQPGESFYIYQKTYYRPTDFHDSRYDPSFSPIAYPGETIYGSVMLPEYGADVRVSLYARELRSGTIYRSEAFDLEKGIWLAMEVQIPTLEGAIIDEVGFCICVLGERGFIGKTITVLIDDLYVGGQPSYAIDMQYEEEEIWNSAHREITQFTRWKGLSYLDDGHLHLSSFDDGEMYTGKYNWKAYSATFIITPVDGDHHGVNVCVQGAIRSYAVYLLPAGRIGLLKKENGYRELKTVPYDWIHKNEYQIGIDVNDNTLQVYVNTEKVLSYDDKSSPYLSGGIGISVQKGSHLKCRKIVVQAYH